MANKKETRGFATKAIHAGQDPEQWSHRSVIPPVVMSTTFLQDAPNDYRGYYYGRAGNPTRSCLEKCLATLDNGRHGFVFSSGMGAVTALTSLVKAGDHILCGDDVYGGTNDLFRLCLAKYDIDVAFVDTRDTELFLNAVRPNTKMIFVESPSNPTLKLADIRAISERIKDSRPDVYFVVDNTFVTSYLQKPLDLGADIVSYSLSKYMNGHSDVIMGALITSRDDIAEILKFNRNAMGIIPSPYDCGQVMRGLKTLELRMQRHMQSGLNVAKFLEAHPLVSKVYHPFLPSHPQHELAKRQMSGHSGMISFYVKGDAVKFFKALKLVTLAGSLGDIESLALYPTEMSHPLVPKEHKEKLGITDKLVRLSVGLETESDILDDLNQALQASVE